MNEKKACARDRATAGGNTSETGWGWSGEATNVLSTVHLFHLILSINPTM